MESSKFDLHSSIVFVFIGSLPVSDSLLPLAVVDVAVGVSVLPFAVLFIFGILALIFETVGLKSKIRLGSMSFMKSRFGQCSAHALIKMFIILKVLFVPSKSKSLGHA